MILHQPKQLLNRTVGFDDLALLRISPGIMLDIRPSESLMELLYSWASDPNPNGWVISRVLSASWSAAYPGQTRVILTALSSKNGTESQVKSAVEALSRHGVEINKL